MEPEKIVFLIISLTCVSVNLISAKFIPYRTTITTSREILDEYDFIVVGGGSAGTLLASRLSEVPTWKILLLEAGEDEAILSDIPAATFYLQATHFNWKYKGEMQTGACRAFENQQCRVPRGKVLGGTGVLNAMIYSRSHRKDHEEWVRMGNPGWSFEECLPFYKKSERMQIPEFQNSPFHNTEGELFVERVPFKSKLLDVFIRAGQELGYSEVDINSGENTGFSKLTATMHKGERCSGNRAFLSKASRRHNLDVVIMAHVHKVLIDPVSKIAAGVEFVKKNRTFKVRARREVILSAGAINSPQLLMLSGVGPRRHLEGMGIRVVKDLPVGDTLRDHVGFLGPHFVMNSSLPISVQEMLNVNNLFLYFNRSGILTMPTTEAVGFIRTKFAPDERPDIEYIFVPTSPSDANALKMIGMTAPYRKFFTKLSNSKFWFVSVILLRPKSKGRIRLRSKNPMDPPIINQNFLQESSDMDVLVEGIKEMVRLSRTPSLAIHGTRLVDTMFPGCEDLKLHSDKYWRCGVRHLTVEAHHQMSTCKMGPRSDPGAVVNPRLQVHGVGRLRVADTSIVPGPVTGHTNAVAYLVAERAADFIKQDHVT